MAIILNIETSTDICSVCISKNGNLVSIRETERSYSHSETIARFIKECVEEAEIEMHSLNAVAISKGPGSYTALRIGAATAKGICFALDIPLIAIDTMKGLANGIQHKCGEQDIIIPLIDARRKEVYYAAFDHSLYSIANVEPHILTEMSFIQYEKYGSIHFCGDGVAKSKDILDLKNAKYHTSECSSKNMISLSEEKFKKKTFENLAYYEPHYYKSPNITVQKKNILQ